MDFKAIQASAVRNAARQLLVTKKHSPTIMFAAGVVGVVATVVMASKATLKLEEIVDETQQKLALAKTLHDTEGDDEGKKYTETDYKRDVVVVYTKAASRIAKLYGPAFVVGTVSIGCLAGAQIVLNRRNAGLTAAYVTVEKAYQKYREQVVKEFGPEKDADIRRAMLETPPWDEDETENVVKVTDTRGEYSFLFDETNPNWKREPTYNQMYLRSQQNYANDLLRARGHVFLNEVLDMLGFEHTKAGSVVGWIANADTVGDGDGYIDFGIFTGDRWTGQRFVAGDEKSVWLEFNVDGIMYDKI